MASQTSSASDSARRVLIITNPTAGARSRAEAIHSLVACLNDRQLAVKVVTDLKTLDNLAQEYQAAGQLRAIVGAGGDGTMAEIVNRTAANTPVAVYPLGTANLLANYFGIDREPVAFAKMIAAGHTARLDAGRANGRIFLLVAGCGFDADVVERLHHRRGGGHISYWTWAKPILDSVRSYEYPDLRVSCELAAGERTTAVNISARWAFIANLPCYAGGLQLAPYANGTDGQLDVSTFGSGSLWHALRYLAYVALRQHQVLSDFKTTLVTRVRIESDRPVPYQLDGDPGGLLPLDIEVLPQRLTLVAPLSRMESLGLRAAAATSAGVRS